jgi:hypothetical protein
MSHETDRDGVQPPASPPAQAHPDASSPATAGPVTIASDVQIPVYGPLDVPYSQWETRRSQELLAANGYGHTADEWRRATRHASGLIRGTAYYLLSQHPEPQDEALYRRGLDDVDETAQVLSAYGLHSLGDRSARSTLARIAQADVTAHPAATRAAGILAELGDASAYVTIEAAMNSDQRYLRLLAVQNAMPFVPLHGQIDAAGKAIDIWGLYRRALQDDSAQVQSVAALQLRELGSPEALELLHNHS